MVYTTMELGTNYSNNKRKIMKELEIIQKRKVVRDYITERFQKQYYGDFNPSEWFSKSNHELESSIDDMNMFIDQETKSLRETLGIINLNDDKKNEEINLHDDLLINELINDQEWRMVYHEIQEKIKGFDFEDEQGLLDQVVDHLTELITFENTKLHFMEILTSRVGLKEEITFKSK